MLLMTTLLNLESASVFMLIQKNILQESVFVLLTHVTVDNYESEDDTLCQFCLTSPRVLPA